MNDTSRNLSAAVNSLASATVDRQHGLDMLGKAIEQLAKVAGFDFRTMCWKSEGSRQQPIDEDRAMFLLFETYKWMDDA